MGDVAADISEAAPLRGRHLASRPAGHGSGLAKASKTSADTVTGFEARGSNPKLLTVMAWRRALEKAGVVFIDADEELGPGVRLREGRKT